MIQPVKTFQLYMAMKLHFTQKSYDVLAHKGHVKNTTQHDLEKRKDKGLFFHFSKLAETPKDMAAIMVANFAMGNFYPIEDPQKALQNLQAWKRNKESLSYTFTKDVRTIEESERHWFTLLLNQKISIMSVVILDDILEGKLKDDIPSAWSTYRMRLDKIRPFIRYDKAKFTSVYHSIKEEYKVNHG